MNYKQKYLKYKLKYLTAKKLYGGMEPGEESIEDPPPHELFNIGSATQFSSPPEPQSKSPPTKKKTGISNMRTRTERFEERSVSLPISPSTPSEPLPESRQKSKSLDSQSSIEKKLEEKNWKRPEDNEWIKLLIAHLYVDEYPERKHHISTKPTIWSNDVIENFNKALKARPDWSIWKNDEKIIRKIRAGLIPREGHIGQQLEEIEIKLQKQNDETARKKGTYTVGQGL